MAGIVTREKSGAVPSVHRPLNGYDTVTVDPSFAGYRFGSFFEFEGGGGDDVYNYNVTSGGFGRVGYRNATDGVMVDLQAGTATSANGADAAGIGNDMFSGVRSVRGSDFDDVLLGRTAAEGDEFRPRGGDDTINGRAGLSDTLRYTGAVGSVIVSLGADNQTVQAATTNDGFGGTDTFIGIENLRGGDFNDTLTGDINANQLRGGGGDDTLTGGDGDDDLRGEDGNDTLIGGFGVNTLRGGAGDDTLIGEAVRVDARFEFNRVDFRDATGGVTIDLTGGLNSTTSTATGASIGTDTLVNAEFAFGSDFADTVTVDQSFTGYRAGSFFEFEGGGGDDVYNYNVPGGFGRVGYRTATDGVTVDLEAGTGTSTNGGDSAGVGNDTFSGIRSVRGSEFDDMLLGRTVAEGDEFRPRGGDDFIDGRGGASDTLRYTGGSGPVIVNLGEDNQTIQSSTTNDSFGGTDTFIGIENLRSGDANDMLGGDINANQLRGGAGDDILVGVGGADDLRGEDGNDILKVSDDTFASVDGGLGQDTLRAISAGLDIEIGSVGIIQGIEAVDLGSDVITNTLDINLQEVLDLSADGNTALTNALAAQQGDLTVNAAETVLIDGAANDIVNLSPDGATGVWVNTMASVVIGAEQYQIYNFDSAGSILATVGVDTDVTTNGGGGFS